MNKRLLIFILGILVVGCSTNTKDDKITFISLAWQEQTLNTHKSIVAEWNNLHKNKQVEYVQSNWSSIHDYLITSFETGDVPDVFHYESSTIIDFALRNNLADLDTLLSQEFKDDIHSAAWKSVKMEDGSISGAPFLLESMVIIYNKKHFREMGITPPSFENPWDWKNLREAAKRLTIRQDNNEKIERYGASIGLRNAANILLNLSVGYGSDFFSNKGKSDVVKIDSIDMQFLNMIKEIIYQDSSISPTSVTQSGASTIPSFINEKYSMLIGIGTWARQQLVENAPEGFEWGVLVPIKEKNQHQAANAQTLSIPKKSDKQKDAAEFIEFFLSKSNMAELAKSDWMAPSRISLLKSNYFQTEKYGWDICTYIVDQLIVGKWLMLPGYAEWKSRVANPLFQEYFSNRMKDSEFKKRMEEESEYVFSRYQRW
jgi:ABC-type glycerol-3-phosphate transport system substrate-binding protein